jgi:hypothetical protein
VDGYQGYGLSGAAVKVRTSIHPQRTPEWFADRLGRVTGSACSAVFAKSRTKGEESSERKKYRLQLALERITGNAGGSVYVNAAMQRGIDLEPVAVAAYEASAGELVDVPGFMFSEELLVGASLDGLCGSKGALEVKCPDSLTHLEYFREKRLPPAYVAQVTHNLWVSGREWLDFVSFDDRFPEPLRLFRVRVTRKELDLDGHMVAVYKFLDEVDLEVFKVKELMR